MAQPFVLDVNLRVQNILGLDKVKAALTQTSSSVGVGAAGGAGGKKPAGGIAIGAGAGVVSSGNIVQGQAANLDKLTKAANNANRTIKKTGKVIQDTGKKAGTFGQQMRLAGTRYAAFALATAAPLLIIGGLIKATQSVIEFDNVLNKLTQILGTSKAELSDLSQTMVKFSVDTGTSLAEIANAGKILAQAGFRDDLDEFLEPLSKIPLLASFESIEQATEGVIATMNQFGAEAGNATDILDRFDAVSNRFAVTASDLVEGVKRGGGAFAALGGNIDEFIALMTTMRAVTRESAQTIGTSIRTVVARINRPRTIKFLEGLGVDVRDAQGDLLGIIDIFSNLNDVFTSSSQEGKAAIAEQLGGFRQISRVLAAVQNPEAIQKALKVSQEASGSIAKNSAKGLKSLSAQIGILGARFGEFVQSLAKPVFIPLIQGATGFLNVVISVVSALGPLIPLFTQIVGFAIGISALGKALALVGAAGGLVSQTFAGAGALGASILPGARNLIAGGAAGLAGRRGAAGASQAATGAVAGGAVSGQLPQIIAATALFAVFNELGKSASDAGSTLGVMGASVLKAAAGISILASLLSKRSILDLGSSLGGALTGGGTGALLAGGALGVGAITAAAVGASNQAEINIDKLVKKAADEINSLDIQITDKESLNEAGGVITEKILNLVQDASEEFSGFTGFFAGLGGRIKALASTAGSLIGVSEADFGGITGSPIDEEKVKEFFTTIFEKSPETFRKLLDQSISEAGPGFRDALTESFASSLPQGADPRIAEIFRNLLIKLTGGDKAAQSKVANELNLRASRLFARESTRISDQLSRVIIPTQIITQLNRFSSGLRSVVSEMDASVTSFKSLAGNIGSVAAPQIGTDTSIKAIESALKKDQLKFLEPLLNLDLSSFTDLGEGASAFLKAGQLVKQLLNDLNASEALAGGQSDLNDVRKEASRDIDAAVQKFLASTDLDVPAEAQDAVKRILLESANVWQEAIQTGGVPDPDKIKSIQERVLKAFDFGPDLAEQLKVVIDASSRLVQTRLEAIAQGEQILTGDAITPTTKRENVNRALAEVDLEPFTGNIDTFVRNIGFRSQEIEALSAGLIQTQGDITATNRELTLAQENNASAVGPLENKMVELTSKLVILEGGIKTIIDLIQASKGKLQEDAQKQIALIQEQGGSQGAIDQVNRDLKSTLNILDQQVEFLTRETKKAQLDATIDSSRIFRDSAETFKTAVASFDSSIKNLTTQLKGEDVPNTAGEGLFRLDKNGNPTNVIPTEQNKASQEALDIQALGAPQEDVLKDIGNLVASSADLGTQFGRGLEVLPGILTTALKSLALGQNFEEQNLSALVQPIANRVSKDVGNFISNASDNQLRTIATQFASQTKQNAQGNGTGADLNSQANIENNTFEFLKALRDGTTVNRNTLKLTAESQKELANIRSAIELNNKKTERNLNGRQSSTTNIPEDSRSTISSDRVTETATLQPQLAELGTALTATTLSLTSQSQDQKDTGDGKGKELSEAASLMKTAADTSSASSSIISDGAVNVQTGGNTIDNASQVFSKAAAIISSSAIVLAQGSPSDISQLPGDRNTQFRTSPIESPLTPSPEVDLAQDLGDIKISSENFKLFSDSLGLVADKFTTAGNQTSSSDEAFRIGAESFGVNVATMTIAAEGIQNAALDMQAVVNLQNQSQLNTASVSVDQGTLSEVGVSSTADAIATLGERIDAVASAVVEQTAQQTEQATQQNQAVVIDGLADNTVAVGDGSEAIINNISGMSDLGDKMASVSSAIEEGIGIDVETMSEVKVDVQGIAEAAKEFTQAFEDVAVRVAKAEIKIVLQQLASASGNSELADTFESVV